MNSDAEMLQAMEHIAVDWRGCREVIVPFANHGFNQARVLRPHVPDNVRAPSQRLLKCRRHEGRMAAC